MVEGESWLQKPTCCIIKCIIMRNYKQRKRLTECAWKTEFLESNKMKMWIVHNVITRLLGKQERKWLLESGKINEVRKWRMNSLLWLLQGASTSSIDVKPTYCLKWNHKISKNQLTLTGAQNDDGSHENCTWDEKNRPTQNWWGPFSSGGKFVESVRNYRGLERSFWESSRYKTMLMHCQALKWT